MPPTLIGNLVERCMKKMSISEVVTVFGGVTGPLVTIHPTLRDFIKERLLNGEEPTNDNIPQAIESFVSELPAVLNELQVLLEVMLCYLFMPLFYFLCHFILLYDFVLASTSIEG